MLLDEAEATAGSSSSAFPTTRLRKRIGNNAEEYHKQASTPKKQDIEAHI
jgi:hypothetical protein